MMDRRVLASMVYKVYSSCSGIKNEKNVKPIVRRLEK